MRTDKQPRTVLCRLNTLIHNCYDELHCIQLIQNHMFFRPLTIQNRETVHFFIL